MQKPFSQTWPKNTNQYSKRSRTTQNHHTSENQVITTGMGKKKPWKNKMQDLSADLNNITAKTHTQDPACKDINMNQPEEDIDHLEYLASAAIKDKTEASNIAYKAAEERDGNYRTTLKQDPPTIRTGNIQTHPRPKGKGKNKTTHLCSHQRFNKHRVPKHRKRGTRNTKPSYTKGYSRQLNLKKPKENSKQPSSV